MRHLIIIIIVIVLISCKHEKSIDLFYVSFGKYNDYEGSDTFLIKQDKKIFKDIYELSYSLKKDTDSWYRKYSLSIDTMKKCKFSINNEESHDFHFFKDTLIELNSKRNHRIFEYILNEGIIDGATLHYWTPEYGIYFIRSTTWPNVTILQSTDSVHNREILAMVKKTLTSSERKFFLRGRLKQMINDN